MKKFVLVCCLLAAICTTASTAGTLGTVGGGDTSGCLHCLWWPSAAAYIQAHPEPAGCQWMQWCCMNQCTDTDWSNETCSDNILRCGF